RNHVVLFFFFSSRRRHTRSDRDWSSDVCSSDLKPGAIWIEYDIGAGTLAIGCSKDWPPSKEGASAALEVADFDAAIETLRAHNRSEERRVGKECRTRGGAGSLRRDE